ncbi:MAG: nucleoside triphosphate pyrophosphohydrolase [Verrucomicrobiales bacterium]|nr:nucleoside triphosphate pyrophosphohydrolase [Verrucomicrobiales bacterium]
MARPIPSPELPPVERLRQIMHILRAPGGCPWDAEQTHESLVKHLIEEAYEVAEAIESGNRDHIIDELGDLLLQPVFHAEIASETGRFDLDDIANAINEKLIRRHPHVFGDAEADDPDAVLQQWEEIKSNEKSEKEQIPYTIKKANEGLPALLAAQKIQKKAAKVGFDWPDTAPVLEKIEEELEEVRSAQLSGDDSDVAEEIGDLLFAVVNLARKSGFEAELLLHQANRKFVNRFQKVEDVLRKQGQEMSNSTLEEMDAVWNNIKAIDS